MVSIICHAERGRPDFASNLSAAADVAEICFAPVPESVPGRVPAGRIAIVVVLCFCMSQILEFFGLPRFGAFQNAVRMGGNDREVGMMYLIVRQRILRSRWHYCSHYCVCVVVACGCMLRCPDPQR